MERTLVMLKPDAFERNLVGEILSIIENKDVTLVASKQLRMTPDDVEKHYKHHVHKGFYPQLVDFMTSGPSLALVYEGKQACAALRQLIGNKHPTDSPPGSIRGRYAVEFPNNLIHGSDNSEEANYEISLYFGKDEIFGHGYKNVMKQKEIEAKAALDKAKQDVIDAGAKKNQFIKYPQMIQKGQVLKYIPNSCFYRIDSVEYDGHNTYSFWGQPVTSEDGLVEVYNTTPMHLAYSEDTFIENQWKLVKKGS